MTRIKKIFPQLFSFALMLLSFFVILTPHVVFAKVNGTVLMAKGVVTATAQDKTHRTLNKGAAVNQGDVINTAGKSYAVIRMIDDTKLTLKPNTTIAIGVFNDKEGEEEACINLIKGGLRTITGLIGKRRPEAFQLDTPVASIGIRGTDFITRICNDTECLEDEQNYLGGEYPSIENPTLPNSVNEQLPEGLYSSCETGVIAVSRCAGQSADFEIGKCRINQQKECTEVQLIAGQAAYVSYDSELMDVNGQSLGVLPLMPHFLRSDPHFRLSTLTDTQLDLIELFKDELSTENQCEISN